MIPAALLNPPPPAAEEDDAGAAAARAALGDALRRELVSEFECPGFQLGYVYADSPVVCPDDRAAKPEPSLETYRPTTFPGARLPHVWLAEGVSVFDRLGPGFTLLRVGPRAPRGAALRAAAAERAIPLEVLEVDGADAGDVCEGVPLVLVRPDQHVAWRSRSDPAAAEDALVLDRVTGRVRA